MFKTQQTRCNGGLIQVHRGVLQKKKEDKTANIKTKKSNETEKGREKCVDKLEVVKEALGKFIKKQDNHDTFMNRYPDKSPPGKKAK